MAIKSLPDADHVVRHVNSQLVERDGDVILGILPQAFMLRKREEYLSASWLEFYDGSRDEKIKQVIAGVSKARQVKASHAFALGIVEEVKAACASFEMKIRILHEPSKDNPNPAYAAVRRYQSDDMQLLELLASEVWSDVVDAKKYL
jgi:hypothetical protein